MEAEIGFHQRRDFVLAQAEHRVLERLDHGAAGKEAQVATAVLGARVLRILLGQFGKTIRAATQLGQQGLGLGTRLGAFLELAAVVGVVERLDVLGADHFLGTDVLQRQFDELHLHLLRQLEACGVGFVERSDGSVIRLDLCGKALQRQQQLAHLALLQAQTGKLLGHGRRCQAALGHGGGNLRSQQIAAQAVLETGRGHVLRLQQTLIDRTGKATILLKRRLGTDDFTQQIIAGQHVAADRVLGQQALVDQAFEQLGAHAG